MHGRLHADRAVKKGCGGGISDSPWQVLTVLEHVLDAVTSESKDLLRLRQHKEDFLPKAQAASSQRLPPPTKASQELAAFLQVMLK